MDSLIPTHAQQCAIHETDAGTFAHQAFLYEDNKLRYH